MNMRNLFVFSIIAICLIFSCKPKNETTAELQTEGRVPVTITHPGISAMADGVELNATSIFLLKTYVKSTSSGYLQEVNAQLGEKIGKGKKLFVIRLKEAANLGNSVNLPDSSFKFSGLVSVSATGSGYITQLNYQAGDYVQDGEPLAEISDANSLVFMLELPYELKQYLPENRTVELTLPDGQLLTGTITKPMPMVDPVSQTQSFVIKVSSSNDIPENLMAKVNFIKSLKPAAISLPKEAIVTNETQSEFWIMKMTDSITAVKTVVTKGIETSDRVEIISPQLNQSDIILLTGNYGLPDTAKVSIIKGQE
jgi:multidrug efflux pump subunit AcrA (membrane-fusion protein)